MTHASPVQEPDLHALLSDMHAKEAQFLAGMMSDPHALVDFGISVSRQKGELLYQLARCSGARRVVECASSTGASTMFLATAVRDNGGGTVIGSELVPGKVDVARTHLEKLGLAEFAELRVGDAAETLRDCGGPIDFVFLDGWPGPPPTLSRTVIELLRPQLRPGATVVNDNLEDDYLDYVRDPANGFRSMTVPLSWPYDRSEGTVSRPELELTVFG